eukprot:1579607-Amphidinium_carterae.1
MRNFTRQAIRPKGHVCDANLHVLRIARTHIHGKVFPNNNAYERQSLANFSTLLWSIRVWWTIDRIPVLKSLDCCTTWRSARFRFGEKSSEECGV